MHSFKELITTEPVEAFITIKERFNTYGFLAPFPEFENIVTSLKDSLTSERKVSFTAQNEFSDHQRQIALIGLEQLDIDFDVRHHERMQYPHLPPFQGRYPYIPTLNAIERAISFLDS